MRKYVGADVHKTTTTFCVMSEKGSVLSTAVVQTTAEVLIDYVRGISGTVELIIEEGTHAAWLYDLLHPLVVRMIVCNPPSRRGRWNENKSDAVDAEVLAELLRIGKVRSVYQGEHSTRTLRNLARGRMHLIKDRTRVKNRIKAVFRSRGIPTEGSALYKPRNWDQWTRRLDRPELRVRAQWMFRELERLEEVSAEAEKAVLAEARKHKGYKLLKTVPGIGNVLAAEIIAEVITPFRFRTKRQFWSYCGFSVITYSSSDWKNKDGRLERKKKQHTRGLTRKYNRRLKNVFKSAVSGARRHEELRAFYEERIANGMREEMARLTLARKIAAIALVVWKKGEAYDSKKAQKRMT